MFSRVARVGLRRVGPSARALGARQLSSLESVFGPAAKALEAEVPGLTPAQLAQRYDGKLAELNDWILQEEADYLASKGESKSLDEVSGPAPLKLYGVAGRYATGLYNSAMKAKELSKVDTDLKKLLAAANASATVTSFISSPTISRADRVKGIDSVASALGLCTTTKNFLGVLAASSRTKFLLPIAHNFTLLTASASGELTVTLTAAAVRAPRHARERRASGARGAAGRAGKCRRALCRGGPSGWEPAAVSERGGAGHAGQPLTRRALPLARLPPLSRVQVMPDLEERPIIDSIKREYMPWQKVRIVRKYDPEIIKGYIVDFGDKVLDKS